MSSFPSSYHCDLFHMVSDVFWDVMLNEAKIWNPISFLFFFFKQVNACFCVSRKRGKVAAIVNSLEYMA